MADVKFKELMSFNNIKNKRTAVGQVYFGLKRKPPPPPPTPTNGILIKDD
jgi:hypothetical protein